MIIYNIRGDGAAAAAAAAALAINRQRPVAAADPRPVAQFSSSARRFACEYI